MVLGGGLMAIALLPVVLRPGLIFLMVLWALNGEGQALVAVPSVRLLAEHTDETERGRVYAAHFALTHLFWLITYPATGLLVRAIGVPLAFSLAGAMVVILTLLGFLIGSADHGHRAHPLQLGGEPARDSKL